MTKLKKEDLRIYILFFVFLAALLVGIGIAFTFDTRMKEDLGSYILGYYFLFFLSTMYFFSDVLSPRLLQRKIQLTDREQEIKNFISIFIVSFSGGYFASLLFAIFYPYPTFALAYLMPPPLVFPIGTILAFTIGLICHELDRWYRKLPEPEPVREPGNTQPKPPKSWAYVGKPPDDVRK